MLRPRAHSAPLAAGSPPAVRGPDPGSPCSPGREGAFWGPSEPGSRKERLEQAGGGGGRGHQRSSTGRGQHPPECAVPTPERGSGLAAELRARSRAPRQTHSAPLTAGRSIPRLGFQRTGRAAAAPPRALRRSAPAPSRTPTARVAARGLGGRCRGSAQAPPGPGCPAAPRPATLAAACAGGI